MADSIEITDEELACIYSAAILADDDVPVTSEKIATILKAANVEVEPIWPMLYARALNGKNVRELMGNIGSGAPLATGAPSGTVSEQETKQEAAIQQESKKEPEPESDSDDDMGLGLFD